MGYEWLELGPFGYLPTEAARLTDELDRRGLKVAGGTVHGFSGLHRPGDWPDIVRITRQVAELTAAVGGRHVVFVPVPGYRDDKTGALPRARRTRRRPVADPDQGHRRAGQDRLAGVRPAAGVPPARGQPRGDPGADGAVPGADRSPLRVALPGHRPPGLPARGQRGPHRPLPRPHRLRAHQADGPGHRRESPTARASRSARPWPWAPAASRPAGNPPSRRWPRPCASSTGTCSWSSSRTCTRPTSTSPSRSRSAPTLPPQRRHRHGRIHGKLGPGSDLPTPPVRVGVIGTGMIGQDHIRRITQVLTGGAVVAVNDVDAARAGQVAAGSARRRSCTRRPPISSRTTTSTRCSSRPGARPTRSRSSRRSRPASRCSARNRSRRPATPACGSSTPR